MRNFAAALIIALGMGDAISGAELQADAIQAWDRYVLRTQSHLDERVNGVRSYLWVQESQERMNALTRGDITVEPIDGTGRVAVPGALIHDWVGAVFLPGATADQVFSKLEQYDNYHELYSPMVVKSKLLARNANDAVFSMRSQSKTAVVSHAIDADYECHFSRRAGRWWSVSRSTRIQEIEHQGQTDERLRPVGVGMGFVWRLYILTRVMDIEGGAVVEVEAIVLSREVPASVAWFVNPIVSRISRNTLATTLAQTREAVTR